MKPTTLEEALAWLHSSESTLAIIGLWPTSVCVTIGQRSEEAPIVNGDIPAAIVEAVGQVWDSLNEVGD